MFGGLPNLGNMAQQIEEFQKLFTRAVEELKTIRETQQEILQRLTDLENKGEE